MQIYRGNRKVSGHKVAIEATAKKIICPLNSY
jgi:hypothetical protein